MSPGIWKQRTLLVWINTSVSSHINVFQAILLHVCTIYNAWHFFCVPLIQLFSLQHILTHICHHWLITFFILISYSQMSIGRCYFKKKPPYSFVTCSKIMSNENRIDADEGDTNNILLSQVPQKKVKCSKHSMLFQDKWLTGLWKEIITTENVNYVNQWLTSSIKVLDSNYTFSKEERQIIHLYRDSSQLISNFFLLQNFKGRRLFLQFRLCLSIMGLYMITVLTAKIEWTNCSAPYFQILL